MCSRLQIYNIFAFKVNRLHEKREFGIAFTIGLMCQLLNHH